MAVDENEIPALVRTLTTAAFNLVQVDRKTNYLLFRLVRPDEFGMSIRYVLAYSGEQRMSMADVESVAKVAAHEGASVVLVGACGEYAGDYVCLSPDELFGKLGGAVNSMLPLEPEYADQLETLGYNRLPEGLKGKPDDLFEAYVHAGLQFLLRGRVIRYGQDRRFEAVPDGLALGKTTPLLLYDCKAAGEAYEFSATAVRQFADYVKEFHQRYESYLGRLYCFVAISSAFQDIETLRARSDELYAKSGVPLVCVRACDLATMIGLFTERVALRAVVDWKEILRPPIVDIGRVESVMQARLRDGVIRT